MMESSLCSVDRSVSSSFSTVTKLVQEAMAPFSLVRQSRRLQRDELSEFGPVARHR